MTRRSLALAGAAIFVILAGAGWAALQRVADPAALRQMVHDRVKAAFSRDLTVGDVTLELLPTPSLFARNMSMRGEGAEPELAARSARAFIAVAPLFSGKVVFDSYDIEDADWQLGKSVWHVDSLRVDADEAMRSFHVRARGRAKGNADSGATALDARILANAAHDQFEIRDTTLDLGGLHLQGDARISMRGETRTIDAHISGGRLDWTRALIDMGHPRLPPLPPDQVLRDTPLNWHLLEALAGWRGSVDAQFDSVRMGNGIEWQRFATRSTFDGERWTLHEFGMGMLGGNAKGSLDLDGARHSAHLRFEGEGLLLERWFRERGSQAPFRGGPMRIKADLTSTGNSMRDLGARMSGNVGIRMGAGVLANPKAGAAEAKLVGIDESKEDAIRFSCAAGDFPFHAGRAVRSPLVAARSDVAWLVTSGNVDFRSDSLELRGRVKPLTPHLGMSAIAGDVLISGKLRHPHIQHDPSRTGSAIARAGAALATLGLSAVATATEDAAAGRANDPCNAVF